MDSPRPGQGAPGYDSAVFEGGTLLRTGLLVALLFGLPAAAQRGVPQDGFPSWGERTLLVLVNRFRAEPSADTNNCSAPVVRSPLAWHYASNRAARFHSTEMHLGGQRMHDSPCVLASNLPSTYQPNTGCDGSVGCACSTGVVTCTSGASCAAGTFTSAGARMQLFGVNISTAWGENIFYVYGNPAPANSPNPAHAWWLSSQGHCNNMNGDFTLLGTGEYRATVSGSTYHYWTENFSKGAAPTGTLIAGSHDPQFSGGSVTFLVNYFDTGGPQSAQLNVDGTCTAMTRQRGTDANGTWSLAQNLSGTTCRRYRFTFVDPRGATVHLPETGSYGVGGSLGACPDWSAAAPPGCPGAGNAAPSIAAAATANPNPVGGATTALSVLGADDGGEGALTYTWSVTSGPAAVGFAPNGSNAAKASTATFTQPGSYVLLATVRDAQGLSASSAVTVVVNAVVVDAGVTPDAGPGTPDAGVSPTDAGSGTPDAGTALPDGGANPVDAGVGSPDAGPELPDGGAELPDGGATLVDGGADPALNEPAMGSCGCAGSGGVGAWLGLWLLAGLSRRRARRGGAARSARGLQ